MSAIQVWEGTDRVLVVYRKLKWRLLPSLLLWYMFACLARADVDAESRCAGLSDATHGVGVSIFLIGYMLSEMLGYLPSRKGAG
jgi:hypothetical protein